ncbi:MAG: FAD-dependent oxidoreductase, partial [Pseudomonadota bacterium]
MKRQKDRLHRVLVIGATPAGVAAANKLGELGIPVTLVDPEPDLDRKLAREEWRLASGVTFNYAHRSGLIRLIRNPRIRLFLPGRITSLKHTPQGFSARIVADPSYVDSERCILCGICEAECPVTTPEGNKPLSSSGRRSLPGRPVIDKRRRPLCQDACPLGVNAQGYVALAGAGKFAQALNLIRRENVLAGICGRVCTHPCEEACRRGELDQALAIRDIKRFLSDWGLENAPPGNPTERTRPQRIAVAGSGPAGLAAAADLARLGYGVTVLESQPEAGGMLRYCIGRHRLPREILDADLEYVKSLGVVIRTSQPVDLGDLDSLREEFDAVILALGAWTDRKLGMPGENLEGVEGCLDFLARVHRGEITSLSGQVAVIGDGNSAFDLARTAKRLGANVTLISWFPRDMIPADPEEVRGAEEEGVRILASLRVMQFEGKRDRLSTLVLKATQPGKPDENGIPWPVTMPGAGEQRQDYGLALVAIGQLGPLTSLEEGATKLALGLGGSIQVDEKDSTGLDGIFAVGDATTGPSNVVRAMASGRRAARTVHEHLSGETVEPRTSRPVSRDFSPIPRDVPSLARAQMPERQAAARQDNFSEVVLGLAEAQVATEASRCLKCGVCSECLLCEEVCGTEALMHDETEEEWSEQAGTVIVADPGMAPWIKGEDVIRAYGPPSARMDVSDMICRGFAAAAGAMRSLSGTSTRPRGYGIPTPLPDPGLSPELRVGVYVCKCNESMGWLTEMDEVVRSLEDRPQVVHAEVLNAACVPDGVAGILRSIRKKGVTRVVLASCLCCPLDFVCSSCTDQRSRLKSGLFTGTGVGRSMVDTCNIRGEALRLVRDAPETSLSLFTGLLERSLARVDLLRRLPTPPRNYNFTTLVIGQSEAAQTSAQCLAQAGLDVFFFGPSFDAGEDAVADIQGFPDSRVTELSGTLGNFQVTVSSQDGGERTLTVGAVIMDQDAIRSIPYMPQEGLGPREVRFGIQKAGEGGLPYLMPGATSVAGMYVANPPGIHVSERKKGQSAAVLAAAVMPRGPRHSKGYTVVVDPIQCRGCGRCLEACPFQAISFRRNEVGGWHAV